MFNVWGSSYNSLAMKLAENPKPQKSLRQRNCPNKNSPAQLQLVSYVHKKFNQNWSGSYGGFSDPNFLMKKKTKKIKKKKKIKKERKKKKENFSTKSICPVAHRARAIIIQFGDETDGKLEFYVRRS